MKKIIYFDNAATTALHTDVLSSMTPYFCDEFANPAGAYKSARVSENAINRARTQAARLIGARPDEIYFYQRRFRIGQLGYQELLKKHKKKTYGSLMPHYNHLN